MGLTKNKYWVNSTFNESKVRVSCIECQEKEFPYDDYAIIHKIVYFFAVKSSNSILVLMTILADFVVTTEIKVH